MSEDPRQPKNDEIAELRSQLEDLAEREERFRDLFENAQVGIYRTTPAGEIQIANPRILDLLGYADLEELRSRDLEREGYHPRFARREFKEAMERDGRVTGFEATWRGRDGRLIHVRENARAVLGPDGSIVAYEGTVEDITVQKRAEEDLFAEKERLDITLQSIAEAVVATDTEGRVAMMNGPAEKITGWPQSEAEGRPMEEVVRLARTETREQYGNLARMMLSTGEVWELADTAILTSREGREKSVTWSMAPIQDRRGEVIGVVIVLHDITDRRRLERELARIEKLESVGILAGGIAHDFNNLLTSVLVNISLARMQVGPESKAQKRLEEAEQSIETARELTQQLLIFARGGSPVRTPTKLQERIERTVDRALRGSKAEAAFDMVEDLWPADVDADQVCRVMANLAINADEAMPQGGAVRVRARNLELSRSSAVPLGQGRYVCLTVEDEGCGIPEDSLHRIFDPFFSTKEGGNGLGLATSHSIVSNHDGHIEVHSRAGEGTTFHIYLPAADEQESSDEDSRPSVGEGRVLVMDDDAMVRAILAEALPMIGYQVEFAKTGEEAITVYRDALGTDDAFDAVIVDLRILGGMGGKEAVTRLRDIDPDICAIVSSGYSDDPVMAEFADYGFAAVLRKPYKITELSEVLWSVLHG